MANDATTDSLSMENIYREWTLQDDEQLYTNRHLSTVKLASLLGRGLHGVESRLKKLTDINSPAYSRLFLSNIPKEEEKTKLTPVKEILRRIQWDPTLDPTQFTIIHYDRIDDTLCETRFDAPNENISGKETQFAFALPEHRIQGIKYRERIVWDKEMRMDCVFGSMNGRGLTIDKVVEGYDEWKTEVEERKERDKKRYGEIVGEIRDILGKERVDRLKAMTKELIEEDVDPINVRDYVKAISGLYYDAKIEVAVTAAEVNVDVADSAEFDTEEESSQVEIIHFLYLFSELVVLLPNELWREAILAEVKSAVK